VESYVADVPEVK